MRKLILAEVAGTAFALAGNSPPPDLPADCPMTRDHRHRIHPWHNNEGVSCWRCHKTWRREGTELVPTYSEDTEVHYSGYAEVIEEGKDA